MSNNTESKVHPSVKNNPFYQIRHHLSTIREQLDHSPTVNCFINDERGFGMVISFQNSSSNDLRGIKPIEVKFEKGDFEYDGKQTIHQIVQYVNAHAKEHIEEAKKERTEG